jgi:sulfide:quinone oxidoreductase
VAGLEALLALRELAEERVELQLLSPEPFYWYRPLAVAEPFELGSVLRLELVEVATAAGAFFTLAELGAVDVERGRAWSAAGARFDYDVLVIACGATPEAVVEGALTFRGPADTDRFRLLLHELEAGAVRKLVFAVPAGVAWSLPLYELALLTAAHLHGRVDGVELALVTPEERPLQLLGAEASLAVRELLEERGIGFQGHSSPLAFDQRRLSSAYGDEVEADRVVALPRLCGRRIEGLPHDRAGFITVDPHGRVLDQGEIAAEGLFAAGDITGFPVKQGGFAAQQADAVAEAIAAAAGAPVAPSPFRPLLRGLLLTGAVPRYLRTELTARGVTTEIALDPLWWPPTKIAARRLSPFLAGQALEQPITKAAIPVELELDDQMGDH